MIFRCLWRGPRFIAKAYGSSPALPRPSRGFSCGSGKSCTAAAHDHIMADLRHLPFDAPVQPSVHWTRSHHALGLVGSERAHDQHLTDDTVVEDSQSSAPAERGWPGDRTSA
ncbi:hypothetical protein Q5752_003608 [Cryptotrichosporon argae]